MPCRKDRQEISICLIKQLSLIVSQEKYLIQFKPSQGSKFKQQVKFWKNQKVFKWCSLMERIVGCSEYGVSRPRQLTWNKDGQRLWQAIQSQAMTQQRPEDNEQ
jgi:hypothetical protein